MIASMATLTEFGLWVRRLLHRIRSPFQGRCPRLKGNDGALSQKTLTTSPFHPSFFRPLIKSPMALSFVGLAG